MTMFREFFTFELKFRFKSLSTYVYFAVWFRLQLPRHRRRRLRSDRQLQWKCCSTSLCQIYNDIGISFFGIIVIAAIFGTSILRDFQRDTVQILFTKPISKSLTWAPLAGSFVATVFAFSGLLFGEFFARWPPGPTTPALLPTTSPGICSRSSRSWFFRSSFSAPFSSWSPPCRARSSSSTCKARRFSCSISPASPFSAPGAHSSISGPASSTDWLLYHDAITRYWTVVEAQHAPLLLVARLRQRGLPV